MGEGDGELTMSWDVHTKHRHAFNDILSMLGSSHFMIRCSINNVLKARMSKKEQLVITIL